MDIQYFILFTCALVLVALFVLYIKLEGIYGRVRTKVESINPIQPNTHEIHIRNTTIDNFISEFHHAGAFFANLATGMAEHLAPDHNNSTTQTFVVEVKVSQDEDSEERIDITNEVLAAFMESEIDGSDVVYSKLCTLSGENKHATLVFKDNSDDTFAMVYLSKSGIVESTSPTVTRLRLDVFVLRDINASDTIPTETGNYTIDLMDDLCTVLNRGNSDDFFTVETVRK